MVALLLTCLTRKMGRCSLSKDLGNGILVVVFSEVVSGGFRGAVTSEEVWVLSPHLGPKERIGMRRICGETMKRFFWGTWSRQVRYPSPQEVWRLPKSNLPAFIAGFVLYEC